MLPLTPSLKPASLATSQPAARGETTADPLDQEDMAVEPQTLGDTAGAIRQRSILAMVADVKRAPQAITIVVRIEVARLTA